MEVVEVLSRHTKRADGFYRYVRRPVRLMMLRIRISTKNVVDIVIDISCSRVDNIGGQHAVRQTQREHAGSSEFLGADDMLGIIVVSA